MIAPFDLSILPYALSFLIFFAVIYFILNKGIFGENNAVSAVIALCSSGLIVWGLTNYTELMDSLYMMLDNLESSTQTLILIAIGVILAFILYKSFRKSLKKYRFPGSILLVSLISILIFFVPYVISSYYLPYWLESFRWVFIVAGIVGFVYGLSKAKKLKLRERKVGDELYEE